jgi:mRNA interferase MazF
MTFRRGDIVLVHYPFSSGIGGSRRPALVVQNDIYNSRILNTVVAQITTNLTRARDPAHHLIQIASGEGQQSGLLHDCVISCINLATVLTDRIDRVIGRLPDDSMQKIDGCLAVSLDLAGESA